MGNRLCLNKMNAQVKDSNTIILHQKSFNFVLVSIGATVTAIARSFFPPNIRKQFGSNAFQLILLSHNNYAPVLS